MQSAYTRCHLGGSPSGVPLCGLPAKRQCGRMRSGRLRRCRFTAAAGGPPGGQPSASARPLPPELRTSERVKYPEVYQGADYAGPGTEEAAAPVEESVLAQDAVSAQDQGPAYTGYEQQSVGSSGVHYARTRAPPQQPQPQQPQQLMQMVGLGAPRHWMAQHRWAGPLAASVALFLAGTFLLSAVRVLRRYSSPRAKRMRTVDLNKGLVDTLSQYLPGDREGLTTGVVRGIKGRTGFSATEIFRKYLWYALRERKFDEDAVADLALLRSALSMTDDEVAEALRERAQRIYEKYGNVMLETAGMTKTGIERKATCRALFSKLLYMAESEKLLSQTGEAAEKLSIPKIFGATDEDTDSLRIVSLYEVDMDNLEGQFNE